MNRKNEVGKKYGRWSVLSDEGRNSKGNAIWKCKCECGTERIITGIGLRSGRTNSCGCLQREIAGSQQRLTPSQILDRQTKPRYCRKCECLKNPDEFFKFYSHVCKKCHQADAKINEEQNRASYAATRFNWYLEDEYGISLAEYSDALDKQKGLCAICERKQSSKRSRLAVDHCHITGAFRGLLCDGCNSLLGRAKDDVFILWSAIRYLQRAARAQRQKKERAA